MFHLLFTKIIKDHRLSDVTRKHRDFCPVEIQTMFFFFSCGIDHPKDYDYCPIGYLGSIYSSNLILIFFYEIACKNLSPQMLFERVLTSSQFLH